MDCSDFDFVLIVSFCCNLNKKNKLKTTKYNAQNENIYDQNTMTMTCTFHVHCD